MVQAVAKPCGDVSYVSFQRHRLNSGVQLGPKMFHMLLLMSTGAPLIKVYLLLFVISRTLFTQQINSITAPDIEIYL